MPGHPLYHGQKVLWSGSKGGFGGGGGGGGGGSWDLGRDAMGSAVAEDRAGPAGPPREARGPMAFSRDTCVQCVLPKGCCSQ